MLIQASMVGTTVPQSLVPTCLGSRHAPTRSSLRWVVCGKCTYIVAMGFIAQSSFCFSFIQTLSADLNSSIQTAIATSSFTPPPLPSPSPAPPCHPPHCRLAPAGRFLPRPHRGCLLGSLPRPSPLPLGRRVPIHSPPAHVSAEAHTVGELISHLIPTDSQSPEYLQKC